jgi:hypothetical protein
MKWLTKSFWMLTGEAKQNFLIETSIKFRQNITYVGELKTTEFGWLLLREGNKFQKREDQYINRCLKEMDKGMKSVWTLVNFPDTESHYKSDGL